MKTDELIAMLGTNVERVDHRQVTRLLGLTVVVAVAIAVGTTLLMLGIRADALDSASLVFLGLKLGFAAAIVALGAMYLAKVARPGGERMAPVTIVALPFIAIVLLAAIALAFAPSSHWNNIDRKSVV